MFGFALIARGVGLSTTTAIRIGSLSILIFMIVALWHVWLRRRPGALHIQPPAWLTAGWTLGLLVMLVPCLVVAVNTLQHPMFAQVLTASQMGQLAMSTAITGLVLPFTGPLILLILAISLSRQREMARV